MQSIHTENVHKSSLVTKVSKAKAFPRGFLLLRECLPCDMLDIYLELLRVSSVEKAIGVSDREPVATDAKTRDDADVDTIDSIKESTIDNAASKGSLLSHTVACDSDDNIHEDAHTDSSILLQTPTTSIVSPVLQNCSVVTHVDMKANSLSLSPSPPATPTPSFPRYSGNRAIYHDRLQTTEQ